MDPFFHVLLSGAKRLTSFSYVGFLAVLTAAVLYFGPLKEADDKELLIYVTTAIALLFLLLLFHRATEIDSTIIKVPIVILIYAVTLAFAAFILLSTGNALANYPRCIPILVEECKEPFLTRAAEEARARVAAEEIARRAEEARKEELAAERARQEAQEARARALAEERARQAEAEAKARAEAEEAARRSKAVASAIKKFNENCSVHSFVNTLIAGTELVIKTALPCQNKICEVSQKSEYWNSYYEPCYGEEPCSPPVRMDLREIESVKYEFNTTNIERWSTEDLVNMSTGKIMAGQSTIYCKLGSCISKNGGANELSQVSIEVASSDCAKHLATTVVDVALE